VGPRASLGMVEKRKVVILARKGKSNCVLMMRMGL